MFRKANLLAMAHAAVLAAGRGLGFTGTETTIRELAGAFKHKPYKRSVTGIYGRNPKRTTAAAQRRACIKARNKKLHTKGCK